MKGKKGHKPCCHLSYLHETLEEWPECNAAEGRGEEGGWCWWFVCVCVESEGGGATAAGQQLILSRETGSARSGQGGGQKVVTPGVKEQTSQRGTSSKAKAPLGEPV